MITNETKILSNVYFRALKYVTRSFEIQIDRMEKEAMKRDFNETIFTNEFNLTEWNSFVNFIFVLNFFRIQKFNFSFAQKTLKIVYENDKNHVRTNI